MTISSNTPVDDREKLLPCPFCGGPASWGTNLINGGSKFVCCDNDECFGPQTTAVGEDSIVQWNRRAASPAPVGEAEKLAEHPRPWHIAPHHTARSLKHVVNKNGGNVFVGINAEIAGFVVGLANEATLRAQRPQQTGEQPVAYGEFYGDKCASVALQSGRFNTVPLYVRTGAAPLGNVEVQHGAITSHPTGDVEGLSEEEREHLRWLKTAGVGSATITAELLAIIDRQSDALRRMTQLPSAASSPTLDRDTWAVTVERNGERVVTIESSCLSGRDLIEGDEDIIRTCAKHLLSFVCAGETESVTQLPEDVKGLEPWLQLGRPEQGSLTAFHDLPSDTVIYSNSGVHITAGDVRTLQRWIRSADALVAANRRVAEAERIAEAKEVAAKAYYENYRSEERRAEAAEASVVVLEKARDTALVEINDADQCFEAALFEGLLDRMAEISAQDHGPGTLPDLVQRRLLPARLSIDRARAALSTVAGEER